MSIKEKLPEWHFGLWSECPGDVPVAWGARAILQDGRFSLLGDRQTMVGASQAVREAFSRTLNDRVIGYANDACESMFFGIDANKPRIRHNESQLVTLFEDFEMKVLANTNASGGYLYIIAFPKHHSDTSGQKWSGKDEVPRVGQMVNVGLGGGDAAPVGDAIVVSHINIHQWVHIGVVPNVIPDWIVKNMEEGKSSRIMNVAGTELIE